MSLSTIVPAAHLTGSAAPPSGGGGAVGRTAAAAVVVNTRFTLNRVTGVQRYAHEVLARLPAGVGTAAPARRFGGGMKGHLWEQAALPARVGGRLLFSPANSGPLAVRRQVVTVHDASLFDRPECFSRAYGAWGRWLMPRLVRRVRRVITVSAFSKARIVANCGVDPDRIVVIPNGVDARFAPPQPDAVAAVRDRLGLGRPYLLAVGSVEPRKNLGRLLEAWDAVRRRHSGVELAIAGGTAAIYDKVDAARADQPGVRWLGYVADADLPALYAGAVAAVYPSLYEGFGLPVLEAMACGTAVVASNATAVPEVTGGDESAGGAAVEVDPADVESIAAGIERVVDDAALRARLVAAGRTRAAGYRWDDIAAETWRVLAAAVAEDE
ncbi:MAG: glycosyl transferase group 1 [Phycisphaerales bacterium]|nr:glycosyl transferase group 1 [Phycisphaerales bacterium]